MKKRFTAVLAALLVLSLDMALVYATRTSLPTENYEDKLEAAENTAACIQAVRRRKEELGISIDQTSDINDTGVIGQDYSAITTTLGNLEAKRTSTNPNMAAVVVDMLCELGLERGDKVAINCSGSFPALNIAVMCAVDQLGLDPLLITSFGSSTHGANDPELTYLDMENYLWEQGLLRHRSRWFSIGGMEDVGREMAPDTVAEIVERLESCGYELYYNEDLLDNVRARYQMYRDYGDIRCFINVGGNDPSFGDSSVIVHADGGILTQLSEKDRSTGLVQFFLRDGTPVVHLLNIKSIATAYGLPIDPTPLPAVGEGGVYRQYVYCRPLAAMGPLAAFALLLPGWRKKPKTAEQKKCRPPAVH